MNRANSYSKFSIGYLGINNLLEIKLIFDLDLFVLGTQQFRSVSRRRVHWDFWISRPSKSKPSNNNSHSVRLLWKFMSEFL